jgi:hypothetical protein
MSPIAWDLVKRPKNMGGMDIKDLKIMNQTLMTKHIWNWLTKQTNMHILQNLQQHERPWAKSHTTQFWRYPSGFK